MNLKDLVTKLKRQGLQINKVVKIKRNKSEIMGLMIAFKEFEFFYFTIFLFLPLRCCSSYPCSRLSFHRKIKLPKPLYVTHEWVECALTNKERPLGNARLM